MATEHSLIFKIGSQLASSFDANFAKANIAIVGVNGHLAGLKKTQNEISKFRGLKNSLVSDKEKMQKLQKEINKMAVDIKNTDNPTKKLTNSFEAKKKELSKLKTKINDNSASLQEYRTSLKNAGVSTTNLTEDSKELRKEMESQIKLQANMAKLSATGSKLKDSGSKQMTKGVAQMGIIGVGVTAAIVDESSFADVKKTTGLEGEKAREFRKELLKATASIPVMNEGLYDIAAAAGQAGIAQNELTKFTKDAAVMAVAFDTEAGTAGETLATWRTAFQMNQEQALELGNQVNYLANSVNAKASDISNVVNRVGAIGKNAGFSEAQVAAMSASLIAMGTGPEVAATSMKNMIGTLTKGTAATSAQSEAYAKLGLNAVDVAKAMQVDSKGTMIDVLERINKLDASEKSSLISEMFGDESKAGVSQLSGNIKLLEENFDRVADKQKYSGSMLSEYEVRSRTTANSIALMTKTGVTLAANLSYVLLPAVSKITKFTANLATKIDDWTIKHPGLTKAVVYTTAGIAGLNVAMGASKLLLGNVITTGVKVVSFFTAKTVAVTADTAATAANTAAENIQYMTRFKSMILTGKNIVMTGAHKIATISSTAVTKGATIAQWALNAALNANPIGLVIGGIALLGAGLTYAYKHSETFRNGVNNLVFITKNFFKALVNNPFTTVITQLKEFAKPIFTLGDKIKNVMNLWNNFRGKKEKNEIENNITTVEQEKKKIHLFGIGRKAFKTKEQIKADSEIIQAQKNNNGGFWGRKKENKSVTKNNLDIKNISSSNSSNNNQGTSIIIQKLELIIQGGNNVKEQAEQGAEAFMKKMEELNANVSLKERRVAYD